MSACISWDSLPEAGLADRCGADSYPTTPNDHISSQQPFSAPMLRALLAHAFANSLQAIFALEESNRELRICYVNAAFERLTGYTQQQLQDWDWTCLTRDQETLRKLNDLRHSKDVNTRHELLMHRGDGRPYWAELILIPAETGQNRHWMVILRDISDEHTRHTQLQHAASHDALTGLPNRGFLTSHLLEKFAAAERLGQQFGLLIIDIDRFKQVNDRLGHFHGDELLRIVTRRLQHQSRQHDFAARWGGDEFILILDGISCSKQLEEAASRIEAALAQPYLVANQFLDITCSVGASLFPDDGRNEQALLDQADSAMYRIKNYRAKTLQ